MLLCSFGYFQAWKYYKKNHFNIAVLILVLCGLSLYIYVSTDFFLHSWDERYHALVAKNLIKHPFIPTLYDNPIFNYDYKNWGNNHIWLHKQPMPLWLMAFSLKVFGTNEIALRLPSIIMSSLGIWLTFEIGKYLINKKVGILAAFLFSINGLIIELTGGRTATDHIDITFMFFILLAIFFIIKFVQSKNLIFTILVGVCLGAAILTKWLTGLIILPIWILLVLDSKCCNLKTIIANFVLLIITILAIALPWQLYIFNKFPLEAAYESDYNLRHFTEVLEGHSHTILYFLEEIIISYGELIFLPLIWFFWKIIENPKDLKRIALIIWFLIPLLVFSIAKTKMQGYILFTAPALFIMTSWFFFKVIDYKKKNNPNWFYTIILILIVVLPIRFGIERVKPFEIRERSPQWVIDLKQLNNDKIENGILLNYKNPIEAMFYTNLTVYAFIPEEEIIIELLNQGYRVIINEGVIPAEIVNIDGVEIIKLTANNDK